MLIGISQQIYAQNPVVIIAPNYISPIIGLAPLPQRPGLEDYHGEKAECASNAMCDAQGQLKFFIVDDKIYDKEGYYIASMNVTNNFAKGRSEISIVKDPANCEQFFIFSSSRNYSNFSSGDEYIMMTLDFSQASSLNSNRMGLGTPTNFLPGMLKDGNAHWAISNLREDDTHFVFFSSINKLHIYYLSQSGTMNSSNITPINVIETPLPSETQSTYMRAELEVNESSFGLRKYRVAMPFNLPVLSKECIMIVDLDENGNLISGTQRIIDFHVTIAPNGDRLPFIHGLEFDETGNYLFVAHTAGELYPTGLSYIDLTLPNNTAIIPLNLPGNLNYQNSQIETLVIDGIKGLYMATENSLGRLDVNYSMGSIQLQNNVKPFGIQPSFMTLDQLPLWDNYPEYKVFLLPDQIDDLNYLSMYQNNFGNCCRQNTTYSAESFTFSSSGSYSNITSNPITNTVSTSITIRDELRVAKGTVVTLKNLDIQFASDAKLIIEAGDGDKNGGRLVLDNCYLHVDTRCTTDALWTGIEVQGKNTENQGSLYGNSQQGRLILKNNTLIEDALRAVLVGAYTNHYIVTQSGGIVDAQNTTFNNNQRDIVMFDYIAPNGYNNQTRIVRCNFTCNNAIRSGVYPISHIQLNKVKGVAILGNTFNHTYAPFKQVGTGIFGVNSSFLANAFCSSQTSPCFSYQPNVFQNLRYGIYVSNSNSSVPFSADRNTFIDNYYGIWANGSQLASITRNNFQVFESSNSFDKTTGIRMIGSTKYQIQENNFYSLAAVSGDKPYGIVIENSGPESNLVYKNTFRTLYIGGQSQRINANIQNNYQTGLIWQCNNFKAPIESNDFTVVQGSISYNQGYLDPSNYVQAQRKAANNLFSMDYEGMSLEHDYALSNSTPINYVFSVGSSTMPDSYTSSSMSTQQSFSSIYPFPFAQPVYYSYSLSCPTKIATSKLGIQITLASLNTTLIPKLALISNGESSSLEATVLNGTYGAKKNALIAASPYVSDEILLLYLSTNPPAGHIMQVMMANSKLSDTVMNAIANYPLPTGIRNMILLAQLSGVSPRKTMEDDIAYTRNEIFENTNNLLRMALLTTDSLSDFSEAISILQTQSEKTYKEMLLNIRILQQNSQEATSLLDTVGVYGRTNELNQIQISTIGSTNTDSLLIADSSAITTIQNIANDPVHCICSSRANSMLCGLYGYPFNDEIFDLVSISARGQNSPSLVESTTMNSYSTDSRSIEINPNPTTGKLFVNNQDIAGTIRVYTMQGSVIKLFHTSENQTEINISELAEGVYFIELQDDKGAIKLTERVVKR
jgi:hypothetical protein